MLDEVKRRRRQEYFFWDEHGFSFASVSVNTKYFPDNVSITHFAPETEISTIALSLKINQTLEWRSCFLCLENKSDFNFKTPFNLPRLSRVAQSISEISLNTALSSSFIIGWAQLLFASVNTKYFQTVSLKLILLWKLRRAQFPPPSK